MFLQKEKDCEGRAKNNNRILLRNPRSASKFVEESQVFDAETPDW